MSKEERLALAERLSVPEKTLTMALIHSSFANERKMQGLESNELRALLGDAVLRTVLVERMLGDGGKKGTITQELARLVSNTHCAQIARNIGMEPLVLVSAGFQVRPFPDSVLATTAEALIGGLYLDDGWEAAKQFILQHWTISQPPEISLPKWDF